jgi:glutathione S-transferase
VTRWYQRWIAEGFSVLEQQAPETGWFGGANANLADICLVPQMYNARRFGQDLSPYQRLVRIDEGLRQLPAFAAAAPEAVRPA